MKIKSAQLSPRTLLHTLKNVVVVADPKRGVIIRSRPKRKVPRTKLQKQYSTRFGFAGVMASSPEPMQLMTAIEMAKGTEQVPRDILTMAALGTYYILENTDGTEWGHVSGPIYIPATWKAPGMELWSMYESANSTSYSTVAKAFKGHAFTPKENIEITGLKFIINAISPADYQAVVGTLDGGNQITTIEKTTAMAAPSTGHTVLHFPISYMFPLNTRCFIMIGRTDGAATYAFPIFFKAVDAYQFPHSLQGAATLESVNPVVGNDLTVTATFTAPIGLVFP